MAMHRSGAGFLQTLMYYASRPIMVPFGELATYAFFCLTTNSSRVVIFTTIMIYIRVGAEIYIKRKQLHNFYKPSSQIKYPSTFRKTTEIHVSHQPASSERPL